MFRLFRVHRSQSSTACRVRCRPQLESFEERCVPATINWTLPAGMDGNFNDAANWTVAGSDPVIHRVPGPADDAAISISAGDNVYVTESQQVRSITATATFHILAGDFAIARPSFISGLDLSNGASLQLLADADLTVWSSTIAGDVRVSALHQFVFAGSGVDDINPGAVLEGEGTYETGEFPVVNFNTAMTLPNLLVATRDGVFFNQDEVLGGHLSVSAPGTLEVMHTLDVPSGTTVTWDGGILDGSSSGVVTIESGATAEIVKGGLLATVTLNNATTLNWTGGNFGFSNGATLNNYGVFAMQADVFLGAGGLANGVLNNAGTLTKSSTAGGTTAIITGFNNLSGAAVQVVSGTLQIIGEGSSLGAFNVSEGATLYWSGGQHVMNAGTTFDGPGQYLVSDYFTNLVIHTDLSVQNFALSAGTMSGPGTLTVTGTLDWTGGSMAGSDGATLIADTATLNIHGNTDKVLDGRTLELRGATVWTDSGSITCFSGAAINQRGTWEIENDQVIRGGGLGYFHNFGTLSKSVLPGTATIGPGIVFSNDAPQASVSVANGTLQIIDFTQNAGTTTVAAGAILSAVNVDLEGGTFTVAGLVNTYTYTQGQLATLQILIAGSRPGFDFGQVVVQARANLQGTLSVSLGGPFVPNAGDTFTVLTYDTRNGAFTTLNLDTGNGVTFSAVYNDSRPGNLTLFVPAPVPPSHAARDPHGPSWDDYAASVAQPIPIDGRTVPGRAAVGQDGAVPHAWVAFLVQVDECFARLGESDLLW